MTFCIGIKVRDGLVVLSDTRVVKGTEVSRKSKLSMIGVDDAEVALMTSGLRSVRDKVVVRVEDQLARDDHPHRRVHEFVTRYGNALREVRTEDADALRASGLTFDSHAIIAGQFEGDPDPVLMHVYPEGNWVEATDDAPWVVIGRSSYGKPLLDRLLHADSTLEHAMSLAYLAFESTRTSASDVDFPIDMAIQRRGRARFTAERFTSDDLTGLRDAWSDHLHRALRELPAAWATALLDQQPRDAFT